ncbi:phage antirepressor N-terminal domain-containing protein, partial [Proteus mirabilis]
MSKNSEAPTAVTVEASNLPETNEVTSMTSISTINVPFHGANLCIVNRDGNPYVPMKPIIEDMGLDWASQFTKLKKRFSKGIVEITIPSKGGEQSMICLAMHKLTGWLYSIMPNKVKPEIRDKVIKYQEECDDVLYEYWTTGEVKKKHKSTVQERNPLKNAVNLLVSKKGIMYPEAYSLVHQKFNVSSIEELTADQIPDAVEYIHKFVLEG